MSYEGQYVEGPGLSDFSSLCQAEGRHTYRTRSSDTTSRLSVQVTAEARTASCRAREQGPVKETVHLWYKESSGEKETPNVGQNSRRRLSALIEYV